MADESRLPSEHEAPTESCCLICDGRGRIEAWIERPPWVGSVDDLRDLFGTHSTGKLLQLLFDAREEASTAVLEIAEGGAVQLIASSITADSLLVVVGDRPSKIRDCAERASGKRSDLSEAAAGIVAASKPDHASLDLWDEISRLNNEMATLHRELAKRNAQLSQLNQRKNELLGMAAHDLRNPISAIVALTDFIRTGDSLSEDQDTLLEEIRASSSFMLRLIDDILDLASIESGTVRLEMSSIEPCELVERIVRTTVPAARQKGISIEVDCPTDLPPLFADPTRIVQVIQNLLTNAVKYSPRDTVIQIVGRSSEGSIDLSITDQGAGIAPDEQATLFEPFKRLSADTTNGERSTGLGLAIVKKLVDAHDGTIEVQSELGAGSTFTVHIPFSDPVATIRGEDNGDHAPT